MDTAPLSPEQKQDLLHRLARVEGQLRGVQRLIALAAEPSDCDAAAQQMAAASKALDRCFVRLLSASLRTQCGAADDLGAARAAADHLAQILDKYL
ncbi:MAG TPA: metal-sensing transcriptional repressor [Telluria sp.]|nr:metal-sensing transcriptional repressor [Telluria sp.]